MSRRSQCRGADDRYIAPVDVLSQLREATPLLAVGVREARRLCEERGGCPNQFARNVLPRVR